MSAPLGTCPTCERALERMAGYDEAPQCMNPRCSASHVVDDTAIARIVIEMRPGVGIVVNWWRHAHVGGFDSLRWFHAMIGSATNHLPHVIRAGMATLAGRN